MLEGYVARLKNKRVIVQRSAQDGDWFLTFKRLPDEEENEKVVTTNIRLSNESMRAVVHLYELCCLDVDHKKFLEQQP